jgi:hypothetical protein
LRWKVMIESGFQLIDHFWTLRDDFQGPIFGALLVRLEERIGKRESEQGSASSKRSRFETHRQEIARGFGNIHFLRHGDAY